MLDALHILKENRIADDYSILHPFFKNEDKDDVSISPSQLGKISQPSQAYF